MEVLTDPESWEAARRAPRILVYKHSPVCSISLEALRHMNRFLERGSAVPVVQVDVIAQRDLSRRIAADVGVEHQSPQVLLLEEGEAVWDASHFDITEERLAERVGSGDGS